MLWNGFFVILLKKNKNAMLRNGFLSVKMGVYSAAHTHYTSYTECPPLVYESHILANQVISLGLLGSCLRIRVKYLGK